MKQHLFLALAFSLIASPAFAAQTPRPGPDDPRVLTVTYHSRDVVTITGHYGFSTVIEFSPTETIETAALGDSEAWQIVKPSQSNILFAKPLEQNANTNMTVITNKRLYSFELIAKKAHSHKSPSLSFRVRFVYPEDDALALSQQTEAALRASQAIVTPAGAEVPPEAWNFDYTYSGSERARPTRVFDDGKFTYFAFADIENTPAIFLVDEARNESLVNFTARGKYIVVERIGRQFTLRDGETTTCIFNESFPTRQADALAPRPASTSWFSASATSAPKTTPGRENGQ